MSPIRANVVYENKHYKIVTCEVYQEEVKMQVPCYGMVNKQTGVTEVYSAHLSKMLTQAEVDSANLENEWWKKQAAKEIDILHSFYAMKMNS